MTHATKISAFVAMGLLMAVSTATAQQKASTITSGGDITYRAMTTDQGEFGPNGSLSSKWGEYRSLPNGASISSLNLWSSGGKIDFNLTGYNVQQKDQQFLGAVKALGLDLKFNWNEIPHEMGSGARTIFTNTTPGVWTMSSTLRQALQNAVDQPGSGASSTTNVIRFMPYYQNLLAPTFAAADLFDLNGQRRTGNVELSLGKHLPFDVTLMYRNEMKKGYRGQAGINENFRLSPALQVGQPLDEVTNDFGVRVAKKFSMGNAYVTVNRNQYQNRIQTLTIDYPFQVVDAPIVAAQAASPTAIGVTGGPSRAQAVMAPDNSANTLAAGFQLKFAKQTRLSAGFSLSERMQDAAFYATTLYSYAATSTGAPLPAMPQNSLNGKTNATSYNLAFSSRPIEGLDVRAQYRVYDLTDKTARFFVPGVYIGTSMTAGSTANGTQGFATADIYDTKSARLSASASYDFKALTVEGQVHNTKLERTNREAEKGTDNGVAVTALYHFNDFLGFRGTYDKSTRTAEGTTIYGFQADEAPLTNTRIGGDLELTLANGLELSAGYIKRKVDYTDRPNRCYVVSGACATNTAVTTPIPNSPVGLLGTSYDSYTGQIDWTANDRVTVGAYMTYEKDAQTNQWSSNPSSATYNLVNYAGTDKTNTYGGHATLQLIPDKAKLMVNGMSQKVDGFMGITAPNAAGSFNTARAGFSPPGAADVPDWDSTIIHSISAQFDYTVTKAWLLGLGYQFEKYDYKDPFTVLNNELLPVSMVMFMKPNDGKYSANLVYGKVSFKF
jgi:Putative outer membrane beta-barrel porin, MtrB/PioB